MTTTPPSVRRVLFWLATAVMGAGTLLLLIATLGALASRDWSLGFGIVELHGRTALLFTLPMAAWGACAIWLVLQRRVAGAFLALVFSMVWAVCLGVDQKNEFNRDVIAIALTFLLVSFWALATIFDWKRKRTSAKSIRPEDT